MEKQETKQQPETYQIGLVKVTKWKNKNASDKEFDSFTIHNSYFEPETKEFKDAKSYGYEDLAKLHTLISLVLTHRVKTR